MGDTQRTFWRLSTIFSSTVLIINLLEVVLSRSKVSEGVMDCPDIFFHSIFPVEEIDKNESARPMARGWGGRRGVRTEAFVLLTVSATANSFDI